MNLSSILVLCIVMILFARSVIRVRRTGTGGCGGNCSECASRCDGGSR